MDGYIVRAVSMQGVPGDWVTRCARGDAMSDHPIDLFISVLAVAVIGAVAICAFALWVTP